MYDYLIVGAGLFGSTFARLASDDNYKCLVIDKENHIAGNCYTKEREGIHVHIHGAHIFHCNKKEIWDFVNRFSEFNSFINSPIAINNGKAYSLPFNMHTFNQIWGVTTPQQAERVINQQRLLLDREPRNLEEQALCLVGEDIYRLLIKDYTEKQWGRATEELPATIIQRLPLRLTWNNNYFDSEYQGIPENGYTALFENMLSGIEVETNIDYLENRAALDKLARKTIFTGKIDEFFDYQFGTLEYRGLRFEHERLDTSNYQGNAVVNFTNKKIPYTRIIEHKHFQPKKKNIPHTYITREYPTEWDTTKTAYYPIETEKNRNLWRKYKTHAEMTEPNIIFGGRLAEFRYYDMHQVIASAMRKYKSLCF